jgi:predicted PurR-regulated permease PerM
LLRSAGMHTDLERKSFLLLLAAVSVAFLWVVFPLSGGILWAVTFAILFDPLNQAMKRRRGAGNKLPAIVTTLLVLIVVILPAVITAGFIVQEGTELLQKLRSGEIDLSAYYRRLMTLLPGWASNMLENAGMNDLPAVQEKLRQSAAGGSQPITRQIWTVSQNTLDFSVNFLVMLYLLFFLLLDGDKLMRRIQRAVPLDPKVQQRLYRNFTSVVRSTVKGNVVVAAIQGALGGIALMVLGIPGALLWGVIMALLSLLPAVGAALVWGPISIYLLASGKVAQGLGLIAWGTVVIGLVDNLLRPMLVGKETRMPDYVVLISTIGGMSLFGISGFVIGPVIAALFIAAWDLSAAEAEKNGE